MMSCNLQKAFKFTGSWHPSLRHQVYVLDKKGIFDLAHKAGPVVENSTVMNIFCAQICGQVPENCIKCLIQLDLKVLLPDRTIVGKAKPGEQKNARGVQRGQTKTPRSIGGDLGNLLMACLACTFERKGMQCKARRAAQGGPLSKRRNAAMRPFAWAAPANPPGSPRKPVACVVAAPRRSTTTTRRCA